MNYLQKLKINKNDIIFFIVVAIIIYFRYRSIELVPDVYSDEEEILAHLNSLIKYNTDSTGVKFPLFSIVGGGLSTYLYMYPMAFLLSFFTVTANSARILQQILSIASFYLIGKAVKNITNNKELSRITFIVLLTIPWGFVQANRIWDPAFVPIYYSIHLHFLSLVIRNLKTGIKNKLQALYVVLSFASLVLLAIVYPPCRIPAVAMWIFVFIWMIKEKAIDKKDIILIFVVSIILSIPLVINLLDASFNSRSTELLVFQPDKWWTAAIFDWMNNFAELWGPKFLFVSGDPNYRHCIRYLGVLGTISLVPLLYLVKSKFTPFMKYLLFTIFFTFISVALTNEGMPHSLRSCLAYPPFSILISLGWYKMSENKKAAIRILIQLLIIAFFIFYFMKYKSYYGNLFK